MRPSDALIILQARVGSSRLPGKSLRPLAGVDPGRAVPRAAAGGRRRAAGPGDDRARRRRCPPGRGRDARRAVPARARTPTCWRASRRSSTCSGRRTSSARRPTTPPSTSTRPAACSTILRRGGVDYVVEHGLPIGGAVEGMRAESLLRAAREAVRPRRPRARHHVHQAPRPALPRADAAGAARTCARRTCA